MSYDVICFQDSYYAVRLQYKSCTRKHTETELPNSLCAEIGMYFYLFHLVCQLLYKLFNNRLVVSLTNILHSCYQLLPIQTIAESLKCNMC